MRALLTMLAAVAVAAAVWFWFTRDTVALLPLGAARPAVAEAAMSSSTPATPADPDAGHRERVQRQLERIAERLTAIEQRLAVAVPGAPHRADAVSTAVIDPQQLRRALDEVDAQRFHDKYAAMNDQDLLAEVGRLQWKGGDPVEAERALQLLLARDLDADTSADARTQLGILKRQRRDVPGSERTLQAVVDERGMTDKRGGWAAYQLAWTTRERDPAAALGIADALAQRAGDPGTRTRARWTAARIAEQIGDVARARGDYQALLTACGDDPQLADVAKDVRYRLDQLDGRR